MCPFSHLSNNEVGLFLSPSPVIFQLGGCGGGTKPAVFRDNLGVLPSTELMSQIPGDVCMQLAVTQIDSSPSAWSC